MELTSCSKLNSMSNLKERRALSGISWGPENFGKLRLPKTFVLLRTQAAAGLPPCQNDSLASLNKRVLRKSYFGTWPGTQ